MTFLLDCQMIFDDNSPALDSQPAKGNLPIGSELRRLASLFLNLPLKGWLLRPWGLEPWGPGLIFGDWRPICDANMLKAQLPLAAEGFCSTGYLRSFPTPLGCAHAPSGWQLLAMPSHAFFIILWSQSDLHQACSIETVPTWSQKVSVVWMHLNVTLATVKLFQESVTWKPHPQSLPIFPASGDSWDVVFSFGSFEIGPSQQTSRVSHTTMARWAAMTLAATWGQDWPWADC